MMHRVAITTGDPDGIGLEVAVKALDFLGPIKNTQFILFRSRFNPGSRAPVLGNRFEKIQFHSFAQALESEFNCLQLLEVVTDENPAVWVDNAGRACMEGLCDALVTGPMSKRTLKNSGQLVGHTEILKALSGESSVNMGFKGSKFSVVLASGHQSLRDSVQNLSAKNLKVAILRAFELRTLLSTHKKKLPIAVLGLNPHAGERGLLGKEETRWISPTIESFQKKGYDVVGPLVPDAAFTPNNLKLFAVFVCLYHDQGLIPFKLAHGFNEGVHLSLGLPFIRTSVDHGTAKDLFGKNKADSGSMIDAIQCALKLIKLRGI